MGGWKGGIDDAREGASEGGGMVELGRVEEGNERVRDCTGFERVDQAGHCWCITTGDRSGKMAKNHKSHSSEDSAT